jgi:hypothetical protein
MYSALWRILPGPRWAKVVQAVVMVIVVLSVSVEWVFPWAAETFIQPETTVNQ